MTLSPRHYGVHSSPFCGDHMTSARVLDTVGALWSFAVLANAVSKRKRASYSRPWRLYHLFVAGGFAAGIFGHGTQDHQWNSLGINFGFCAGTLILTGSHPELALALAYKIFSLFWSMERDELFFVNGMYAAVVFGLLSMRKTVDALWVCFAYAFLTMDAHVCDIIPAGTHWLSHGCLNFAVPSIVSLVDTVHDAINREVWCQKEKAFLLALKLAEGKTAKDKGFDLPDTAEASDSESDAVTTADAVFVASGER